MTAIAETLIIIGFLIIFFGYLTYKLGQDLD